MFETNIAKVAPVDSGCYSVTWSNGQCTEHDQVLYATGRRPLIQDLGLENAGVERNDSGAIRVDAFSKTTADSVYAIGDVTDRAQLTPVATQARPSTLERLNVVLPCCRTFVAIQEAYARAGTPDKAELFFRLHELQVKSWGASTVGRVAQTVDVSSGTFTSYFDTILFALTVIPIVGWFKLLPTVGPHTPIHPPRTLCLGNLRP